MSAFHAPLEDILTTRQLIAGQQDMTDYDSDISASVITQFARFAEEQIAPVNGIGDAEGCRLTPAGVVMPEAFKPVYNQLIADGWQGLSAPEEFDGMGLDKFTAAGVSEIFSGACHALQMVCNLVPGAIAILENFASPDQQKRFIPPLARGEWLSTMCLSEPEAGSDLSRIRCMAETDGTGWHITGEKIFISGGDQNLSENILHFVLARTGPAEKGLAALSLFACQKLHDGAANGVKILRVEEKLGIHASPTCHMRFDKARAELIGEEGAGLQSMFTLMNHARIDVALQGVAHAQQSYQLANAYAMERIQGRKKDKSPARLSDHSDIQRMLSEQRVLALGSRAMCYTTLHYLEAGNQPELVEFLTPLCKFFCSEAGIRSADLAIQILGGYGYLREYQVEQIWRDARITSIYEGTNGIHARAMVTRNLRLARGKAADDFLGLIKKLNDGHSRLDSAIARWEKLRQIIEQSNDPEAYAQDFTQLSAHLLFRSIWQDLAKKSEGKTMFSSSLAEFACHLAWPVQTVCLNVMDA